MSFGYAMQKFGEARQSLMLPLWEGRTRAIVMAGFYCRPGIDALSHVEVRDDLQWAVDVVNVHLANGELRDPHEVAESMTDDDVRELAKAINELADYAHREFWYDSGRRDVFTK